MSKQKILTKLYDEKEALLAGRNILIGDEWEANEKRLQTIEEHIQKRKTHTTFLLYSGNITSVI